MQTLECVFFGGLETMERLWEQALGSLKTHLSDENFETWLEPVQFGGIDGGSVVLRIPNQFFADWISANYLDMILETLKSEAGERAIPTKVRWELDETLREKAQAARESARRTQCINHVKQLGLALHNFHNTHEKVPPARWFNGSLTWAALLLPHLEATTTYDMFDTKEPYYDRVGEYAQ